MIEPDHPQLSIGRQCELLSISRSSFYYKPMGETEQNLELMRQIDEQFLETPFFGVRQMTWHLRNDGHMVNQKRIRRLMRLMGLMPIYQKPNTSRPAKGHKIYPYLLKGLRVDRPNQVWCADITYRAPRPGWSGVHMTGMHGERRNGRLPCPLLQGGMSPSGGDLPSTGRVT
jgi:putative transposase